ncbi:MAG: autotransporter adhesin family protein, partial [Bacteroidota bacterium]|nr:autotransporter adhesin family protein [Bacteroidota bacterium]
MKSFLRVIFRIFLLSMLSAIAVTGYSQNRIISSGNWSNTSIWQSGNIANNINEDAVMNDNLTGTGIVAVDANYTVGTVNVGDGNELRINSNRTLTLGNNGHADDLYIGNGSLVTVNVSGSVVVYDDLIINANDGAVLTVNGSVTIRGDITLNNGASLTVNGTGSVTVLGDILYPSGNADLINNGNLTASDVIVVNGNNGNALINTGTLGFANIDVDDGDFTFGNSGTTNQSGNFLNVDNGSAFHNLTNGTWNFSGTQTGGVRLFAANYPNTFNYNRGGNQGIIIPEDAYGHLVLSNSGTKSTGILSSLSIIGNWTRTGSASFAAGLLSGVSFSGSVPQSISGVGGETFSSLTIDNSSAISPQLSTNEDITVGFTLRLDDGNFDLNGGTVALGSGTILTPGTLSYNSGWLYDGKLMRYISDNTITVGTEAGLFPMGTATDYRPFFVGKNNAGGSEGFIAVSHTDTGGTTNVNFTDNTIPVSGSTVSIRLRHNATWLVAATDFTAGSFSVGAGGTGFYIGALSDVRLTRAANATAIGTATATTGSVTNVVANRAALTFSQLNNSFYLGSINATNSPLPITLAYFRAMLRNGQVISSWKTLQEKNNDFFTVQKTTDFETFYEVVKIDGQGNSAEEMTYEFVDPSPLPGRSYYRLKQTDYDGKFT